MVRVGGDAPLVRRYWITLVPDNGSGRSVETQAASVGVLELTALPSIDVETMRGDRHSS